MYRQGNDEKDHSIVTRFTSNLRSVPSMFRLFARLPFYLSVLFWVLAFGSLPSLAQGIVLDQNEVLPRLKAGMEQAVVFLVNGPRLSWSKAPEDNFVAIGSFQKPLLALATLRLADAGTIDLDTSIAPLLPGVLEGGPFRAPVTIRHLLQETGGFASPPLSLVTSDRGTPPDPSALQRFAISVRSPGQVSSHDPVGWALLVAVLEAATGKPIETLVNEAVLQPVRIGEDEIRIRRRPLAGTRLPLDIEMTPPAFGAAARLLVQNRDAGGNLFLAYQTYQDLTRGLNGHRLHPDVGPVASYGVEIRRQGTHSWLEPINTGCESDSHMLAFPHEGAVFGAIWDTASCLPAMVRENSMRTAQDFFPGQTQTKTNGPPLARPSQLEGRYIPASRSPAALSERLDIMQSDWLLVFGYRGDELRVRRKDGEAQSYRQKSAYVFDSEIPDGPELVFSPFKLGGYLRRGDKLYRRADILGATAPLKNMIPWALLAVATAGYYAFRSSAKPWKRMGQFALAGSLLVSTGLYAEVNLWPTVLYGLGEPWLITLWRVGLNIGLMLVLSLPMFVLSFARKKTIPMQGAAILTAPHLVLVAVSALMVFFTLVLWGVAGTFAPY